MQNLDEQLNKITDDMKQELYSTRAIDTQGHVINQAEFNSIIDKKIRMCYSIAKELETSGKRFDANDNNKILSTIDLLRSIKGSQSLNPYAYKGPNREQEIMERFSNKQEKRNVMLNNLKQGMIRLFTWQRKTPTPEREK